MDGDSDPLPRASSGMDAFRPTPWPPRPNGSLPPHGPRIAPRRLVASLAFEAFVPVAIWLGPSDWGLFAVPVFLLTIAVGFVPVVLLGGRLGWPVGIASAVAETGAYLSNLPPVARCDAGGPRGEGICGAWFLPEFAIFALLALAGSGLAALVLRLMRRGRPRGVA